MQRYMSFSDRSQLTHLRRTAYYVQRAIANHALREAATHVLLQGLKLIYREERAASHTRSCLAKNLRGAGHFRLDRAFTQEQCRNICSYLLEKRLVDYHGEHESFLLSSVPAGLSIGSYPLDTVVNCPHVMELANSPDFLNMATDYLGFKPTLTDLSLEWSFPTDRASTSIRHFHRKPELGTFEILVYITNVDSQNGPYVYVPGSHLERIPLHLRDYSDVEIARNYGAAVVITGPAGAAFAIDTKGIHKRAPSVDQPSLVLSIQYSLLPYFLDNYEPVAYYGNKHFDKYVNRFLIFHSDVVPYPVQAPTTVDT